MTDRFSQHYSNYQMRFVTVTSGQLVEVGQWQREAANARRFSIGIPGLDEFLGPGLTRSSVHELLYPANSARPMLPAMLLARAAAAPAVPLSDTLSAGPVAFAAYPPAITGSEGIGAIVISDPQHRLYPPAAAQLGIPLSRLYLLHPKNREEELWALSECLACGGTSAVMAELGKLSQVEARRLQLAAERGGSLGLWIRPAGPISSIYAAATRLLVEPIPATAGAGGGCQRWRIQLLHGHGCQIGKGILLEYNREEHTVHTTSELADRTTVAETAGGANAPDRRLINPDVIGSTKETRPRHWFFCVQWPIANWSWHAALRQHKRAFARK